MTCTMIKDLIPPVKGKQDSAHLRIEIPYWSFCMENASFDRSIVKGFAAFFLAFTPKGANLAIV